MSDRVIVVGVDGSRASLAALRWALHEAALRQVDLRVVGVVDIRMQPMVPLADKLGTDLMDAMVVKSRTSSTRLRTMRVPSTSSRTSGQATRPAS